MVYEKGRKPFKCSNTNKNEEPIVFNQELSTSCISNSIDYISNNCTSKIYQFKNLPEPRNATEGIN